MGNCLGLDVSSKYKAGEFSERTKTAEVQEAQTAVALLQGSMAYSTFVEINVKCYELKEADLLSKTDGMGVLYQYNNDKWTEASRTEMIANNQSPSFVKRFRVLYCFEKVQKFKLVMVDIDKGQDPAKVDPASCNFLGQLEFVLGEVVAAKDKTLSRNLQHKDGRNMHARVRLVAEEASNCKLIHRFQMQAQNLRNVELVGKSDPFLQISRLQEDGHTWLPVYKTETRKNDLSPTWDKINVRATQLNNGDLYRPLRFEVFDYEASGAHRPLGWVEMSTEKLQALSQQPGSAVELLPPRGKATGSYGSLKVMSFISEPQPTFIDYIQGGTEVSFVVGIDFTASNGDPRLPTSKHYFGGGMNQYERAIRGVGGVLEFYDQDRMFPVFGFGGTYQGSPTNHCFPLTADPYGMCAGTEGIVQAYRHAITTWALSGPTLFAPLIRMASGIASATRGAQPPKYTVLLILTDGAIMDMADTVSAVVDASTLPMSILIVGIGNDDFGNMQTLDGDKKRLASGGRVAARDIVQFVEFNQYASDGTRLAQELLAELPGQLLQFMTMNKIPCPQVAPAAYQSPSPMAPQQPGPYGPGAPYAPAYPMPAAPAPFGPPPTA